MITNDKKFIIFALIGGVAALVIMIGFIGQGNIRETPIFFPEKVKQTVAFQDVNGKVKLVGISGIGEDNNPTLIMRISFAYVLTVINQGETEHRLYIEGFDVQTNLLFPGEQDTITIYPKEEGEYNYYDKRQQLILLGKLKAVEVVPSDSFEGIMRDLI
jgi:hypothetical protein